MADARSDDPKQTEALPTLEESPDKTFVIEDPPQDSEARSSSVDEVLEHLHATSALLDSADDQADAPQQTVLLNDQAEEPAIEQRSSHEIAHELSIEQYMAELLERSNGRGTASAAGKTISQTSGGGTDARRATVAIPSSQRPDAKPPEKEAKEVWVQKAAPECRDTLTDLRALANMNARTALDAHCGQRLILQMHNKLIVALVSIVVSFAMIYLATSIKSAAYFGAVAALIASIAWSMMYMSLGSQLGKIFQPPPEAEKPSSGRTASQG